jgi:hypothetical protein
VGRLPRRGSPEVKEGKEDPWKQSRGGWGGKAFTLWINKAHCTSVPGWGVRTRWQAECQGAKGVRCLQWFF